MRAEKEWMGKRGVNRVTRGVAYHHTEGCERRIEMGKIMCSPRGVDDNACPLYMEGRQ